MALLLNDKYATQFSVLTNTELSWEGRGVTMRGQAQGRDGNRMQKEGDIPTYTSHNMEGYILSMPYNTTVSC